MAVFDLREDEVGQLLFVVAALGRDDELAAAVAGVGAPPHSGIASGLASTALQIATAAGLAVLVGIANVGGDSGQAAIADGLQTGLYVIAAAALVAIPAALALPNRRDTAATP